MLRRAIAGDLPRIGEIRDAAQEDRLSDPAALTAARLDGLLEGGPIWVWEEDGAIAGFAAGDPRDGRIWALLVAPGHEGKGIGRALLNAACNTLRAAGHKVATLALPPDSRAERHYRAAGWSEIARRSPSERVFQKPL